MPTIVISTFGGEVPRTAPRLLENTQATEAVNCQLRRGALEALAGPDKTHTLSFPARTVFKHDVDGWLAWNKEVNVIKSAVTDVEGDASLGHLFITGDRDYPTQYLTGGHIYRLGIPRPASAPIVKVDKTAAVNATEVFGWGGNAAADVPPRYGIGNLPEIQEDGIVLTPYGAATLEGLETTEDVGTQRFSAYCYTLVRRLAGGVIQQESAPSPATDVVDVPDGGGCVISGFKIPGLTGLHITHIRIYRTVSGVNSTDFRFLAEISVTQVSYQDTAHDKDLPPEVLATSKWDPIPDDARGLIKTDNGLYAAFRGNELLISEPFIAYAFPAAYRLTVEDAIVALGHVDGTIIVLTRGRPYLAAGAVPESLQPIHLPIEQACVSARSVGSLPGGVVYASPDGLMLFTANEQSLLTSKTYTREQWQALRPETLLGTVHDDRYVAFFEGTNRGLLFSVGARDVVRVELADGWEVLSLYHHSEDDCVYITARTPEGNGVWRLEAGEPLPYRWRSKPFFTSALTGMAAVRVEGEQTARDTVRIRIFGPDGQRPKARLRLADTRAKRLPITRAERLWSLELTGTATVYEARMGGSIEGVEYGR